MHKNTFPTTLPAILALLFLTLPLSAQWNNAISGNGNVVEQDRQLSGFTAVEVSSGIDLYLTQGSGHSVKVITDENIQERVKTEVSGNRLSIGIKDGGIRNTKKLEVHVTLPTLEALSASGGSDVIGRTPIRVSTLNLQASGGSDVELELTGERLEGQFSGGSDSNLKGTIDEFEANTSGGSDLHARDLKVRRLMLSASGGSDAEVFASESIDIQASGASDVRYGGNPTKVNAKASSASDIVKM